jgi:uncharacterized protein (TIRG00374 family)
VKFDWRAALGIGISIFLLWWVFRGEDLGAIAVHMREADFLMLLAAVAVATFGYLIRAIRWHLLLKPLADRTTLRSRFAAVNIGFMANNLLPARMGEVARAYALSRMEPVTTSGALASLVVERTLDALALLLLLMVTLAAPSFPVGATVLGRPIGAAVVGLLVILGILLTVLLLMILWPRPILALTERIGQAVPGKVGEKLVGVVEAFIDGLKVLHNPVLLLKAMLWSIVLWLWMALSFWMAFRAFGIDQNFVAAMFTQCAVALFVAVPAAPGFIGTFHAGVAVSLQEVFGVAAEPTLSLAVGYHIGGFIPVTIIGLYYLSRLGVSLSEVSSVEDGAERTEEDPGGG